MRSETHRKWHRCLPAFLHLLAGACVLPMLGEVCYGWDDCCRKLNDDARTTALAWAIVSVGIIGAILSRWAPRRAWISTTSHIGLLVVLLMLCARPLGQDGLHRHDTSPTEGWSWSNACYYSEKRALALWGASALLAIAAEIYTGGGRELARLVHLSFRR